MFDSTERIQTKNQLFGEKRFSSVDCATMSVIKSICSMLTARGIMVTSTISSRNARASPSAPPTTPSSTRRTGKLNTRLTSVTRSEATT